MSNPKYTFMCWPTLDMTFDIHADDGEEALEKLHALTDDIINECCAKLFAIGGLEGGADFPYITDYDYEEDQCPSSLSP